MVNTNHKTKLKIKMFNRLFKVIRVTKIFLNKGIIKKE